MESILIIDYQKVRFARPHREKKGRRRVNVKVGGRFGNVRLMEEPCST